ncbi:MAG: hypothetical protein Q8R24_05225 [Legionellaceae bacterium]|nr:hypothetical protein [Legionellaceae bacterium]
MKRVAIMGERGRVGKGACDVPTVLPQLVGPSQAPLLTQRIQ